MYDMRYFILGAFIHIIDIFLLEKVLLKIKSQLRKIPLSPPASPPLTWFGSSAAPLARDQGRRKPGGAPPSWQSGQSWDQDIKHNLKHYSRAQYLIQTGHTLVNYARLILQRISCFLIINFCSPKLLSNVSSLTWSAPLACPGGTRPAPGLGCWPQQTGSQPRHRPYPSGQACWPPYRN